VSRDAPSPCPRTYAAVTPARNEGANLRRLGRCLAEQTVHPTAWIIVDDGSEDDTRDTAAELAHEYPWISLEAAPAPRERGGPLVAGRRTGRDVVAFMHGVDALPQTPDVVVKLDADVSFERDFFERLLDEFAADPTLGIASGTCYELEDGVWRAQHSTRSHVRGATRAYRWSCALEVFPLEQRLGWDGVDELLAIVNGWRTDSIAGLPFLHHRAMGERDGSRRAWLGQGDVAHFMGYRVSYLLLRTFYNLRRDPAAVALLWGYAAAALRRQPRYADPRVRAHLRRQQSLRQLPTRLREALGRMA
jgi:biofilm PGA synthesis N-glycosyltransferase PgaC